MAERGPLTRGLVPRVAAAGCSSLFQGNAAVNGSAGAVGVSATANSVQITKSTFVNNSAM